VAEKREHGWGIWLLEILGDGIFESEIGCLIGLAFIAVAIIVVIYQQTADPQLPLSSLGADLCAHFDSLSINPDKWA
jgi:hypothetical protein